MSVEKSSCSAPHSSMPTALAAVRLCWPGTGLSWASCSAGASLVPHWWMHCTWQQEWHFSTSTSSITSFIANWFLWGFKRFLQKAAPENNPCHVGSSQQSASGWNLIRWHIQYVLNNFGGKNTTTKNIFMCSVPLYYKKKKPLRLNIKCTGLNHSSIMSAFPVVCNMA